MPVLMSTVEVEDYESWRSVFDEFDGARRQHGMSAGSVYRDLANPNRITVVIEGTEEGMKAWAGSEELKDAESRAGVLKDQTWFVEDVS